MAGRNPIRALAAGSSEFGSRSFLRCGIIIGVEIYDARSAETFAPSHDSGDSHYHVSMPTASRKDVCPLVVQLLGGLRLTRGGEDIRLPRRKVETLFAYLLLHREAHSREKLASLGWGDFPDAQARASLRNALAVLRKLLGEDCLLTDSASVQLNPSFAVQVDACEFETATDPAAAIALYRGDLLPDCYDEWVSGERERLRTRYLDLLLQQTQQMRSLGEYTRACALAEQALAAEPANERAHQHLIFCRAASGDRQGALDQYARCRTALRDELGVEPAPETRALYTWLQQVTADAPALRPTNMPTPLTSFIGRRHELAELGRLLATDEGGTASSAARPAHWAEVRTGMKDETGSAPFIVQPSSFRLLTLLGTGGSGKTRLAIQAVLEQNASGAFRDGIWWIELASLADPALLVQLVARVMGVQPSADASLDELLRARLRHADALLVLDNCEHLITACAQFAAGLLGHCPQLKILATSREPLGIDGETLLRVPALSIPPADVLPLERLMDYEGVQLFVERARMHQPDFALNEQNAPAIALICRQLEGIPLAIELAAARSRLLKPETIAARLSDRFQLLTEGNRAAPARHQTLRALIDWSYDLLNSGERTLLQRLSVFAGGFTLRTAEAVCVGSDLDEVSLLDNLSRLVDKSLIAVNQQGEFERYTMLETIRQYAGERLAASGEADAIRERHLDAYARYAAEAAPQLRGPHQVVWLKRLDVEHDNLRAALTCSQGAGCRAECALQLAADLAGFWRTYQYFAEGHIWLKGALAVCGEATRGTRARALVAASTLALWGESSAEAEPLAEQGLALYREIGDQRGIADGLRALGHVRRRMSITESERLLNESLCLSRELDDRPGMVETLKTLAYLASLRGHDARSRALYTECLTIAQDMGDLLGELNACKGMGCVALAQSCVDEARSYYERALALAQSAGLKQGMSGAYTGLGEVARSQGNYRLAAEYYLAGETLRDPRGNHDFVPARYNLGAVALEGGRIAEARQLFDEGLRASVDIENQPFIACFFTGFAGIACGRDDFQRAARLLGAAQAFLDRKGIVMDPADRMDFERHLAVTRGALADEAFSLAWDEGRALDKDAAIALALATRA